MTQVLVILLALLIGVIAGLRAMTAPAVVAWGHARLDRRRRQVVGVGGPSDHRHRPDDLPAGGTRHRPATEDPEPQDGATVRHPTHHGRFRGAVIGSAFFHTFSCIGAGIVGAVLGTLGGAAVRTKLYEANNGKDRPGAFIEDVVAVGGGFLVAFLVSLV